MRAPPSAPRAHLEELLHHLVRRAHDLRGRLVAALADDELAELLREVHVGRLDRLAGDAPEHAFARRAELHALPAAVREAGIAERLEILREVEEREREALVPQRLAVR